MSYINAAIAADLKQLGARIERLLVDLEHFDLAYFSGDDSDSDAKQRWEAQLDKEEHETHEALQSALFTLEARLGLYADALGLRDVSRRIVDWKERWPHESWAITRHWATSEADGRESRPYSELQPILDGLLVLTGTVETPPPDPVLRKDRERLEHALRSLAKLCRDRNIKPSREHDVQQVMHSHFEGMFDDYTRKVTISKPLVSFAPDAGIPSLKAAIECKFVGAEKVRTGPTSILSSS